MNIERYLLYKNVYCVVIYSLPRYCRRIIMFLSIIMDSESCKFKNGKNDLLRQQLRKKDFRKKKDWSMHLRSRPSAKTKITNF